MAHRATSLSGVVRTGERRSHPTDDTLIRPSWGYVSLFCVGALGVAILTAYHIVAQRGQIRGSVEALAVGLFILVYGGLLANLQRARALTQKVQRQQVILNLLNYAEQIVESIPEGLLLVSPQLRVMFANRSFLERFHLSRDRVVGRRLDEVVELAGLGSGIEEGLQYAASLEEVVLTLGSGSRKQIGAHRLTLMRICSGEADEDGRLLLIIPLLPDCAHLPAPSRMA